MKVECLVNQYVYFLIAALNNRWEAIYQFVPGFNVWLPIELSKLINWDIISHSEHLR